LQNPASAEPEQPLTRSADTADPQPAQVQNTESVEPQPAQVQNPANAAPQPPQTPTVAKAEPRPAQVQRTENVGPQLAQVQSAESAVPQPAQEHNPESAEPLQALTSGAESAEPQPAQMQNPESAGPQPAQVQNPGSAAPQPTQTPSAENAELQPAQLQNAAGTFELHPANEPSAESPEPQQAQVAIANSDAGVSCTAEDLSRMNATVAIMTHLAATRGLAALGSSLPKECKTLISLGGVNSDALAICMDKLVGISPECSACQVKLVKAVVGTGFQPGCIPSCVAVMAACQPSLQSPSKHCLAEVGKCSQCAFPALQEHTRCMGASIAGLGSSISFGVRVAQGLH